MTVYEVSNNELKEFYLCASPLALAELMRAHCDRPPTTISHWKKAQGVFYREVEKFPDEAQARAFVAEYAGTLARTGWTVLPEA